MFDPDSEYFSLPGQGSLVVTGSSVVVTGSSVVVTGSSVVVTGSSVVVTGWVVITKIIKGCKTRLDVRVHT